MRLHQVSNIFLTYHTIWPLQDGSVVIDFKRFYRCQLVSFFLVWLKWHTSCTYLTMHLNWKPIIQITDVKLSEEWIPLARGNFTLWSTPSLIKSEVSLERKEFHSFRVSCLPMSAILLEKNEFHSLRVNFISLWVKFHLKEKNLTLFKVSFLSWEECYSR